MIKCPECKKDVSSSAVACPACGFPVSKTITEAQKKETSKGCFGCFGVAVILFAIASGISNCDKRSQSSRIATNKCLKEGCNNKGMGWTWSTSGEKTMIGMIYGAVRTRETGGYCSREHANR